MNKITKSSYKIPVKSISVKTEIKQSKFNAYVGHASSKEAAEKFIKKIRSLHPKANHNCFAYITGSPSDHSTYRLSDDGEPKGTAGKPMLKVLQHSGIGEIVAVVTRYFGGTKLGTGGLVRAYSGIVNEAIKNLKVTEHILMKKLVISAAYEYEKDIRHLIEKYKIQIESSKYKEVFLMILNVPEDVCGEFNSEAVDVCRGEIKINYKN